MNEDNLLVAVGCYMLLPKENKHIKTDKRLRKPEKGKKKKSKAR